MVLVVTPPALFIRSAARHADGYTLDAALADPPRPALFNRDGTLYTHPGTGCQPVRRFDSLPPIVWQSLVSVEDRRFFEHRGVDYVGLASELLNGLCTGLEIQTMRILIENSHYAR